MEIMEVFSVSKPVLLRDNWSDEEKEAVRRLGPEEMKRFTALVSMHYLLGYINSESAFYKWTRVIPDCPTVENFIEIAKINGAPGSEEDPFQNAVDEFKEIWRKYSDSGLSIEGTAY